MKIDTDKEWNKLDSIQILHLKYYLKHYYEFKKKWLKKSDPKIYNILLKIDKMNIKSWKAQFNAFYIKINNLTL